MYVHPHFVCVFIFSLTFFIYINCAFVSFLSLDVVYDCHQSKPKYCKFLPKTQSLDIVDETSIANINLDTQKCFESINEELLTDFVTEDSGGRQSKSTTSRDEINATCQARPIFPNLSYSPLSSPRINRKPAKESRRVSIDKNGSFLQLNQYKLMDQIGVVSISLFNF